MHHARLRVGNDRPAREADVASRVESAEVLEDPAEQSLLARQLAARVDDDRNDRAARLFRKLRADRGIDFAAEDRLARSLREDEEAVAALDALSTRVEDRHEVLARRLAPDGDHPHVLGGLREKRQMGERRLRHVAERPERQKHRHEKDGLRRRHVVAEIDDWTFVLHPGVKPLDHDAEPELFRGRDGREARPCPLLRREEAERLGQGAVGKHLGYAKRIANRVPRRLANASGASLRRRRIRPRRAEGGVELLNFRLLHFRPDGRPRALHGRAPPPRAGP